MPYKNKKDKYEYNKNYYDLNKDKINKYQREYRKKNKEKFDKLNKTYHKEYRKNNAAIIKLRVGAWYQLNKESHNAKSNLFRINNKDKMRKYQMNSYFKKHEINKIKQRLYRYWRNPEKYLDKIIRDERELNKLLLK